MRVFHLRTGDRGAVERVDAWLAAAEVSVVAASDVFEACATLIRDPGAVPELCAVGLDWIADDEAGIFDYFRDTWPSTVLLIYAADSHSRIVSRHPLTITAISVPAMVECFSRSPREVVESVRLRAAPRLSGASGKSASVPEPSSGPALCPAPDLPPLRAEPPPQVSDNSEPHLFPSGLRVESPVRAPAALTREELAALLNQDFS